MNPNHLYTQHKTYSGGGCAICGKELIAHEVQDRQLVDGKEVLIEADHVC